MINKLKISFLIFFAFSFIFLGVSIVNAASSDLVWSADQTIDLSSPDLNLIIDSGSTAESLVVNTGTIVPTLTSGDTFTVATEAVGSFTVSPSTGVAIHCGPNLTPIVVIMASGTQAYTITPSATACVHTPGSGGGGGGAVYTPPTTTVVATPVVTTQVASGSSLNASQVSAILALLNSFGADATTVANVQASLTGGTPVVSQPTTGTIDFGPATLRVGSKGEYVKAVQTLVGAIADGNFGPNTKAKVMVWQAANGLVADGIFGPASKAKAKN